MFELQARCGICRVERHSELNISESAPCKRRFSGRARRGYGYASRCRTIRCESGICNYLGAAVAMTNNRHAVRIPICTDFEPVADPLRIQVCRDASLERFTRERLGLNLLMRKAEKCAETYINVFHILPFVNYHLSQRLQHLLRSWFRQLITPLRAPLMHEPTQAAPADRSSLR